MGTINNTIPRYDVCIYLNSLSYEMRKINYSAPILKKHIFVIVTLIVLTTYSESLFE